LTDGPNIPSSCYDNIPVKVNVNTQSKKITPKNSMEIVTVFAFFGGRNLGLEDCFLIFKEFIGPTGRRWPVGAQNLKTESRRL
jgi:hypothetical protein